MKRKPFTYMLTMALLMIGCVDCQAQNDSLPHQQIVTTDSMTIENPCDVMVDSVVTRPVANPYRFRSLQLVVPTALISVGLIGLESDWLKYQNKELRDELTENIDRKITIDDFSQFAPMVAVYGLDLCGVKARHDVIDRTILLATATALMGITINTLKSTSHVERPDGSNFHSFPSGHTATAFVGAELLRREYWDASPWIGITGYAVAAGTGFFRMYNNRHWLTDVLAGAGIGILSVQAAYWLYPSVSRWLRPHHHRSSLVVAPFVGEGAKGLTCSVAF